MVGQILIAPHRSVDELLADVALCIGHGSPVALMKLLHFIGYLGSNGLEVMRSVRLFTRHQIFLTGKVGQEWKVLSELSVVSFVYFVYPQPICMSLEADGGRRGCTTSLQWRH